MNILLVEDELLIAEMLKEMLVDMQHQIIGIAKNYEQAIAILEQEQGIEVAFLDINLGSGKNGIELAEQIQTRFGSCNIIFLTSYTDKATIQKALQYRPEAYLIKPFSESDVYATLEILQAKKQVQQDLEKFYILKDGTLNVKLALKDILYLESDNIYTKVHTTQKKYVVRNSLTKLLEEINYEALVRVHRTFAVNLKQVQAIKGSDLIVGEHSIPISRNYKDEINLKFKSKL